MNPQINSQEQLQNEIAFLRSENKKLTAQLSFHRRIFRNVHSALESAENLPTVFEQNDLVRMILEENEDLKNRMKVSRLSTREVEIMHLVKDGLTSKDIGEKLNISKLTVDTHRKNIMNKLEVGNTAELIRFALLLK